MKQLKKKSSLVEHVMRVLEHTNEELIRKYGAQNAVVQTSSRKLVISVPTRSLGVMNCTSRSILEWPINDIFELEYCSENLHRN